MFSAATLQDGPATPCKRPRTCDVDLNDVDGGIGALPLPGEAIAHGAQDIFEEPLDALLDECIEDLHTDDVRSFLAIEDGVMKCYLATNAAAARLLLQRGLMELPVKLVSSGAPTISVDPGTAVQVPPRMPPFRPLRCTAADLLVAWFEDGVGSYPPMRLWTPDARAIWSHDGGSQHQSGKFSAYCKAYVYVRGLSEPLESIKHALAHLMRASREQLEAIPDKSYWVRAVEMYESLGA